MLCVKCLAPILWKDETANHGTFHLHCYLHWLVELQAAPKVKVQAKAA